ncbi:DUF6879 family protein [Krasilnikovia cinnamomea]|uniref:DUF6879 family protein n=1 Tax=Krasilnikovia cinnamomea TaxID=349313 RepID=UPI001A928ED3|nr:DUF6879 family protein [Krasilnikovia cinnamomea]
MPGSRIADLLKASTRSAIHLELRDWYTLDDPDWRTWRAGQLPDVAVTRAGWSDMVREVTARGVAVRRLRVISEPVSDYVHYEYDITAAHNLAAGEDVRWLSRRVATDLFLPPADFWVIDDVVVFNHFNGDGDWIDEELRDDAVLAARLTEAFDVAWAQGTPHADYRLPTS